MENLHQQPTNYRYDQFYWVQVHLLELVVIEVINTGRRSWSHQSFWLQIFGLTDISPEFLNLKLSNKFRIVTKDKNENPERIKVYQLRPLMNSKYLDFQKIYGRSFLNWITMISVAKGDNIGTQLLQRRSVPNLRGPISRNCVPSLRGHSCWKKQYLWTVCRASCWHDSSL